MNKKFLMAAIGAALAAGPMMAAQAAPTVYGHLHLSMDNYDNGKDATSAGSTTRGLLSSNSSRFGIKGDEDLGGGLKTIYQMESGAFNAADGSGGLGGTLRNTYVGFAGSTWGSVKFGRHDAPVKDLDRKIDLFNEQIGDNRTTIGGIGRFSNRVSNMVRYDSPSFSGVTVALQYGTPEVNTATRYTSGNAIFSQGPLLVGLGYEKHSFGGTVVSSGTAKDESAIRLVGKYTMGDLILGLDYDNMSNLTGVDGNDGKAWALDAGYKIANNLLKFQYAKADKTDKSTVDNGGKMYAVGVDHSFSKTTMVYVNYAKSKNDNGTGAFFPSSGPGGHDTTNVPSSVSNGASPKAYSVGMIHNF
jgi:predicted porin